MSDTITPSTWHACKEGQCPCGMIWAADGMHVATAFGPIHSIDGHDSVPSRAEQIANAKLIASAPTMAARILELERMLSDYEGEP